MHYSDVNIDNDKHDNAKRVSIMTIVVTMIIMVTTVASRRSFLDVRITGI